MLSCIKGGRIIDPQSGRDGVGDLFIRDGRIVAPPPAEVRADETFDATGKLVMAGGIDLHSHIAGVNVNTARLLLPEQQGANAAVLPAQAIGRRYAEMGFTTVVEPAVPPQAAIAAQLELAEIPIIDKAMLVVLGNDEYLLSLIRERESRAALREYVAFRLASTQALGVKVINAGGAAAFRANVRQFSLDDIVPEYGVSSRQIVKALQGAVAAAGVPHPLHVHCNNLGLPGNADTALKTIAAAEELPLHLAHLQFYGYGTAGPRRFSSEAARLAEAVNASRNVSVDVGQVMFGQTVTISLDVLRQFNARGAARPNKWRILESEDDGAGIVPYNYRARNFYNVVQWAVGLELFLLINNPAQVHFSTDHPNGAPFTAYPEILALLMDRERRAAMIAELPTAAIEVTNLPAIRREYSLSEIALMTRSAPARLLGLYDRGHLGVGARADIAVYAPAADPAQMFRAAALVFKNGALVVRNGEVVDEPWGRVLTVRPQREAAIDRRMNEYFDQRYGLSAQALAVHEGLIDRPEPFELVPCRS